MPVPSDAHPPTISMGGRREGRGGEGEEGRGWWRGGDRGNGGGKETKGIVEGRREGRGWRRGGEGRGDVDLL